MLGRCGSDVVMRGEISLLLSPFLFALAIVIAKIALTDGFNVFMFNSVRNLLAFIFACVNLKIMRVCFRSSDGHHGTGIHSSNRSCLFWSVVCGIANALGMTCSGLALARLNTAKFSFLLCLCVVITPCIGQFVPTSKKLGYVGWLSVCVSLIGTYFLVGCGGKTVTECGSVTTLYDGIALGAAFFYSIYTITIELGSSYVESSRLTQGALGVSCIVLLATLALFCYSSDHSIFSIIFQLHWTDIFCTFSVGFVESVAWLLETHGVKHMGSSRGILFITLEAPFTAALAYFIFGDSLGGSEILGCVLVFLCTIVVSLDTRSTMEDTYVLARTIDDDSVLLDKMDIDL